MPPDSEPPNVPPRVLPDGCPSSPIRSAGDVLWMMHHRRQTLGYQHMRQCAHGAGPATAHVDYLYPTLADLRMALAVECAESWAEAGMQPMLLRRYLTLDVFIAAYAAGIYAEVELLWPDHNSPNDTWEVRSTGRYHVERYRTPRGI